MELKMIEKLKNSKSIQSFQVIMENLAKETGNLLFSSKKFTVYTGLISQNGKFAMSP